MNTIKKLALVPAFAFFCGAAHAQELTIAPSEYITKAPQAATVKVEGDEVRVSFDVTVPEHFIGRNEAYIITPEFRNGEWSQKLPALSIEGPHYNRVTAAKVFFKEKKYQDSTAYLEHVLYNGKEMPLHYQLTVPRTPEMAGASLVLLEEHRCDCYSRKAKSQASVTPLVTEPITPVEAAEPEAIEPEVIPATPIEPAKVAEAVRVKKQHIETFDGQSVFRIRSSQIDQKVFKAGYDKLCTEIGKIIDNGHGVIDAVSIKVASSPEGSESTNLALAQKRGEALRNKLASGLGVEPAEIGLDIQAENWDGFTKYVKQSDWKQKDEVLDIIAKNENLDAREAALRNMPHAFYYVKINPAFQQLRNCFIVVDYTVDAKTE